MRTFRKQFFTAGVVATALVFSSSTASHAQPEPVIDHVASQEFVAGEDAATSELVKQAMLPITQESMDELLKEAAEVERVHGPTGASFEFEEMTQEEAAEAFAAAGISLTAATVENHKWGRVKIVWSREETRRMAAGIGACASAVVGALAMYKHPVVAAIVKAPRVACALAGVAALSAVAFNRCIAFSAAPHILPPYFTMGPEIVRCRS